VAIIIPANSAADTAYSVDNSCRFNDGDTAHLKRTFGSEGDRTEWTFSCWIKRGILGTQQQIFGSGNNATHLYFESNDTLKLGLETSSGDKVIQTNRVFRDCSAWYHIVANYDSNEATTGNRMRIYVNGVEETSFSTETQPSSGESTATISDNVEHNIGYRTVTSAGLPFDGYMAEVVFIDGDQLTPTSFGEFNSDSPTIWQPIDVSGLTFGTNGFYLDFEDSSNLGNDANGGTDWTEVNLAAADQATDTPTNNFCTLNPLDAYYAGATFSEGNCKVVYGASGVYPDIMPTMGVSTGKWYWEYKWPNAGASNQSGINDASPTAAAGTPSGGGRGTYGVAYMSTGQTRANDSVASYGDAIVENHIIGTYLDLDNNKLYWALNGVIQNSGTGFSITAAASTTSGIYFPTIGNEAEESRTHEANFGGCPSFTISSGNADANGYGNFEYSPNDGGGSSFDSAAKDFLAICTKNLGSDGG